MDARKPCADDDIDVADSRSVTIATLCGATFHSCQIGVVMDDAAGRSEWRQ